MPTEPRPDHEPLDDDLPGEAPPASAGSRKLQRWVDLLAALLARSAPATFERLAREVPEYHARLLEADQAPDATARDRVLASVKRAFERDKQELRTIGVHIESVADADGNAAGSYRLRRTDFYLPYLALTAPGAPTAVRRGDRWGYHALTTLAFEPEELQAVVEAARLVRGLGDPLLTAEADRAMRKLAVDLPVGVADDAAATAAEPRILLPAARTEAAVYEALADALYRRKRVAFRYHALGPDRTDDREVEPYGLFFLHGHWYLAARDLRAGAVRNFRLSRIREPKVRAAQALSADYAIPETFTLRAHAASRQAWELGEQDAVEVTVRFTDDGHPAIEAKGLGAPVDGRPGERTFRVRRLDAFVRWLLSLAGDAVPLSPPDAVAAYRAELERLAAHLAEPLAEPIAEPVTEPDPSEDVAAATATDRAGAVPARGMPSRAGPSSSIAQGAAEELKRLLLLVPLLADGEAHSLDDVATRAGLDRAVVQRLIFALVARYDLPGGFVEGVQLYLEGDRVSANTDHFLRPMRLVTSELCALSLGLAVLRNLRPPDERAALDRARDRLDTVIARLPGDPLPEQMYHGDVADPGDLSVLATVRSAIVDRHELRIGYRKAGTVDGRDVRPYALIAATGSLYLVAHCLRADDLRLFRLDRIASAERLDRTFILPEGFCVDATLDRGRAFLQGAHQPLRVRYSARIARWIAEREGVAVAADGSLTMAHPLADPEWAVRHVLQYGADATVLAPEAVRGAVAERVRAMLAQLS
jgi:predicted DNA-binding transcriptional regulator YafY